MNSEQKQCQNCKSEFRIEPEDFAFYEKIKVPPPTWCPECRFTQRFIWRNERTLYKRKCGLCNRTIVTLYSPDKSFTVYCSECYHSDKWNPLDYGEEIDFSRPFFEQFRKLQRRVPRLYAFVFQNVNSEYTNGSAFNKNCYLLFVSDHNEDSMYSYSTFYSKDTFDCLNSNECELCYESITCQKCYRVHFSQDCTNSQDLYLCKNCTNCQNCFGSVNLRNKQYYIFNQPHSKDEYFKKLKDLGVGSYKNNLEIKDKSNELWSQFIVKYIHGYQNTDVVGDYIFNSKKSQRCYDSEELEDSKYINHGVKAKDCYDCYVAVDNSELSYHVVSAIALHNVKFGYCLWHDFDVEYSDTCENSNHLFGCIGLRKQQYCILNKQYTKEEYETLIPKIIEHMANVPYIDKKKREYKYGEFFPPDLSPFAYNETVAQEYFPLTKKQAEEEGYPWKDYEEKRNKVTLSYDQVPDDIKDASESILNEGVGCQHAGACNEQCTIAFKIVLKEFEFYKKMNLPLPRLCPNCRHYQRIKQRNPLKLWQRTCACGGETSDNGNYHNSADHSAHNKNQHCPKEFETTYAPDRPEIVYCEQCYQAEVV